MSYTYYQAKNPATINDEVVTESELSERLQSINSMLDTLENKTTNITREGDKMCIPDVIVRDLIIREYGIHSSLRVFYDEHLVINISGLNKLVECYGALTATNVTFTNKTDIETLQTKTQNIIRIPGTEEDPTSYTEIDGVSFQTTLERISNIEGTLTKVSYDPLELLTTISGKLTVNGNITASNLTGIAYNSNLQLQGTDYCSATILNRHIYIELTAMTYAPHLGLRIHKTNLSNGQELMLQVGKDNTRAISFVYKHDDTIANSQYRLDFAGRNAYICNYGATTTEHEIRGNLKVYGSVAENASRTITHYTMYEGDLQPGFFVESTGQIFRNGETSYEN